MEENFRKISPNNYGEGEAYYIDGDLGLVPLVTPTRDAEEVAKICRNQCNQLWQFLEDIRIGRAARVSVNDDNSPTDTSTQPHAD